MKRAAPVGSEVSPPAVTVTPTTLDATGLRAVSGQGVAPDAQGAVTLIRVSPMTVKATGTVPKRTAVAPVKHMPLMVSAVPPLKGPWLTLSPDTTGGPGPGASLATNPS